MKLIRWFAGIFEDQGKQASSKRIVLFITLYIFNQEVQANIKGIAIDEKFIYVTAGLIAFCVGAITTEFISKFLDLKKTDKPTTPEA